MWSLVLKDLDTTDERIMILAGASHIALIKEFIDKSDTWESVELKEAMETK